MSENLETTPETNEIDFSKFSITDEILEEVRKDVAVDEFNLYEECRQAPNTVQKYIEIYYAQKRKLNKLKRDMEKIEGDLFYLIKKDGYKGLKVTSGSDIKLIIQRNKAYQTSLAFYSEQFEVVDFYKKVLDNLNSRRFDINKMIELKKLEGN